MDSDDGTESSYSESSTSSIDSRSHRDPVDVTVLAGESSGRGTSNGSSSPVLSLARREGNEDDDDEAPKIRGSIHRLSVPKLRDYLHLSEGQNVGEEDMIRMLVRKFNKDKEINKKGIRTFQELVNVEKEDILERVLEADNFSVRLYTAQSGSIPAVLQWYDERIANGSIHTAWFFCRAGDIFAITTNQGYHLVHEHCEFSFPRTIANRLCTEKGPQVFAKRLLVGPDWAESKVKKSTERQSVRDFPSLYTNFRAELRKDASIRDVSVFRSSSILEFKAASVKFSSGMVVHDLPKILHNLSTIAKDGKTYQFPADEQQPIEEESMEIYDGYLEEFPAGTYVKLQTQLKKEFSITVESGYWHEFPFSLGYKHHLDFALATKIEVQIQYKVCGEPSRKSPWIPVTLNPSLKDIDHHLKRYININYQQCASDVYDG